MKKAGLIFLILALGFAVGYFGPFRRFFAQKPAAPTFLSETERRSGPCPGKTEILEMKENLMPSSLPSGKKFRLLTNWYACNPVTRGDLVYYRFSFKLDPVARIVRGVPGDRFKLVRDEKNKAWNIEINGQLVTTSDGGPRFFGSEMAAPLLSLYEKSSQGILAEKNYILFTEVSPGDRDSGTLGVVNVDDFLGKIEISGMF